jgi:hypothetical protein
MMSYADRPGWFEAPARWIARSICGPSCSISCFDAVQNARLSGMLRRMQARQSLARGMDDAALHHRLSGERRAYPAGLSTPYLRR